MYRYTIFYYILWFITNLPLIDATNSYSFDTNQCTDICSDSFFLLPKDDDSQKECQRGCRFSTIIDLTAKGTLSDTKNDCYESCIQSYIMKKSKDSCVIGCDAMVLKKQSELHYIFPYLDQYSMNDQEFESIENDFFLDPLIRQQVQQGHNIKYKIPEAYIRTLPVGNDFNLITGVPYKYYKNNVVCFSLLSFVLFGTALVGFLICIVKIVQSMLAEESQVDLVMYQDVCGVDLANNDLNEKKDAVLEQTNDKSSFAILV